MSSTAAQPLRAVRDVLAGRRDRAVGAGEVSYRVYLAIMLMITVGAPVVRVAVLGIAEALPHAAAAPWSPGTEAALTAATAIAVLAGAHAGPAHASLPRLDLLFTSPISRVRLLGPAVVRTLLFAASAGGFLAGLVAVARGLRGELDPLLGLGIVTGGAAFGVLAAVLMLLAQHGRAVRVVVAAALGLLVVQQVVFGGFADPWTRYAEVLLATGGVGYTGGAGAVAWGTAPIALCAAVGVCGLPWLLRSMRLETLRAQSANWDAAGVAAFTGDPRTALARFGAPVRTGRGIRWRPPSVLRRAIVSRDFLGLVRTPGRSIAGIMALLAAGGLSGLAAALALQGAAWSAAGCGAAAALGSYLSVTPLMRGFRAAADGLASPPLLPASPGRLLAYHAVVPGALAAAIAGIGAAAVFTAASGSPVLAAAEAGAAGWLIVCAVGVAASSVLLRALAALKGPLPQKLLAPVPTPAGDLAGVNVALWMLDGAISSVLVGALMAASWAWGAGPVTGLIVHVIVLVGLAVWLRARAGTGSSGLV